MTADRKHPLSKHPIGTGRLRKHPLSKYPIGTGRLVEHNTRHVWGGVELEKA